MEFFLEMTLLEFNQAGTRLNWSWSESFSELKNVLGDRYCTTWLKVLTDHFPEPLENKPKATRELKRRDKKENLYRVISIFICKILRDQKPCNRQYIYMQLGGDYPFWKDLMTPLQMHARQFKEMLWIAKALPAGNWSKPLEALAPKWFYMSFHKNDHNKFITAGKKLDTETFESVTKFLKPSSWWIRMTARLNAWSSSISRNTLNSSSRTSFVTRFALARMSIVPTEQSARSLYTMPEATLTTIARRDVGTLTAITIAIAHTTTNAKRQSALVLSALVITTGRMTVATISLKI
jgi:hypothetical protein